MSGYRVAEFEKVKGRQVFKRFAFCGYELTPAGRLYKNRKPVNTTDKRKVPYCEVNYAIGRKDKNGVDIYAGDYVYSSTLKQLGVIKYLPTKAAFLFCIERGKITVPYSFLDMYEVSLLKKSTIYEKSS